MVCLHPPRDGVHTFLFPVTLLLLLPRETEVHASVTDNPNHDDASSYNNRIIGRMETLVGVKVLRNNSIRRREVQIKVRKREQMKEGTCNPNDVYSTEKNNNDNNQQNSRLEQGVC